MPPEQLAALSHELRTPLNGVIGMTRLLESTRLTAEQKAYVGALAESGEHLLGLVNDVLDYSRLGAGAISLATEIVDIEALLRSVCELLSPRAHEKAIEIGWAVEPGTAAIVGDEIRLRQILLNFAGNAVKFVDQGGVLVTAGTGSNGRTRFVVADTGPGVPEALRAHIFEAFTQIDPGQAPRPPGAGLGLAIARRLATAMAGEVGVEETADGGARFWFEAAFGAGPARVRSTPLAGLTVAIASPSPIIRQAAALAIEGAGGRALAGEDVEAALGLGGEEDVLLIDHALAQPGGLATLPFGRTAVILLAAEDRGLIGEYRSAGYAGYLIKPLRRASIVARVLSAARGQDEAANGEDERIEASEPEGPIIPTIAGARVLLAEDNPINAMLAGAMLRKQGCRVDQVTDGEAALAAASSQSYDLVLMDMRMPLMDGIEATRALRSRGIDTPVVALTANAFDADRIACLAAGMDDFLVKPLGPEGLAAAVVLWTGPDWTAERRRGKLAS